MGASKAFGGEKKIWTGATRKGPLAEALDDAYNDIDDAFVVMERRVVLTKAAEAGNAIAVTVQVKDGAGADVAEAVLLRCEAFAADMTLSSSVFSLAETGAGAEVSTTAKATLLARTSAGGVAVINVVNATPGQAGAAARPGFLSVLPVSDAAAGGSPACLPSVVAFTFAAVPE